MYDTSLMLMSSLVSTSINSDVILKPKGNELGQEVHLQGVLKHHVEIFINCSKY